MAIKKTSISFSFFLMFLSLLAFSPARAAKTVDEVALTVEGETMTQSELDEAVQNYFLAQRLKVPSPQSSEYQQAQKQVMDDFIQQVLLAAEADRQKIQVTEGEIEHSTNQQLDAMRKGFAGEQDFLDGLKKEGITLEELRQNLRTSLTRRMKAARALKIKQEELPQKSAVTEEQTRAYYEQHPLDYEQAKFSMILFRIPPRSKTEYVQAVKSQASQVLKEIRNGADFAAYAKKYSEDPGSAEKGGEVGSVYRSQMPPSLAKGVFAIPDKSLGLVKTSEAVYVIRLESKTKADYASVAPEIQEHLKNEGSDSALKGWIRELRSKAYVEYRQKFLPPDAQTPAAGKSPSPAAPSSEEPQVQVFSTGPSTSSLGGGVLSGTTSEISESSSPSNLPEEGSLALHFGLKGWLYNTQDLSDYPAYASSGTSTSQGFPFGWDASIGLDLAVDPTFQLGVLASGIGKAVETVGSDKWSETVLGAGLAAKLIFPLDPGVNAIIGADGGYDFLVSSSLNGTPLDGGAFSGEAEGAVEFFLDSNNAAALDLTGGYRYLQISATGLSANQTLDFSGLELGLGLKFYLNR